MDGIGDFIKGEIVATNGNETTLRTDEGEEITLTRRRRDEDLYIAVDATCPSCGHPERRARFDEHGALFSCRQCPYVSRERDA